MGKVYIFMALALLVVVSAMNEEIEETPMKEGSFEEYGWTCIVGGDAGCRASCAIQHKRSGGHCEADNTCVCD